MDFYFAGIVKRLIAELARQRLAQLHAVALTKAARQVLISRTRQPVVGGDRWSVDLVETPKAR